MLSPSCSRQSEKPLKTESQREAPPTAVSSETGEREELSGAQAPPPAVSSETGQREELTGAQAPPTGGTQVKLTQPPLSDWLEAPGNTQTRV